MRACACHNCTGIAAIQHGNVLRPPREAEFSAEVAEKFDGGQLWADIIGRYQGKPQPWVDITSLIIEVFLARGMCFFLLISREGKNTFFLPAFFLFWL